MIVSLVLKATALVLIGLVSARFARSSRAAVRHAILLATFAALAILPIAAIALPTFIVDVPLSAITSGDSLRSPDAAVHPPAEAGARRSGDAGLVGSDAASVSRPGFSPGLTLFSFAVGVWLAGIAAFLAPLAIGVWRVQRLRRTALPTSEMTEMFRTLAQQTVVRQRVDLLMHEQLATPITCGVANAAIIVPPEARTWSAVALRRALVHEIEHVRRRDWAMQLLARVVCAVYWFNPLVWMAYRQLCLQAEHACDDAVVAREEGASYAEQLVTLARRMSTRSTAAALGMAHRSDLAARVSAVLDATRVRGPAGIVRAALIATSFAALIMALAPLQLSATTVTAGSSLSIAEPAPATQQAPRRARRLDRMLVEVADDGDAAAVRELIDQGADVNAAVDGDGSALIAAARRGHMALVTFLVERGADPNLGVPGDGSPLIMAAGQGHLDIVRFLLDRGVDINQVVPGDENALIQASREGRLAVVQLLVARGADINAKVWAEIADQRGRRGEWRTPLNMAERGRHHSVVAFLRSAGAVE